MEMTTAVVCWQVVMHFLHPSVTVYWPAHEARPGVIELDHPEKLFPLVTGQDIRSVTFLPCEASTWSKETHDRP